MGITRQILALLLALEHISFNLSIQIKAKNIRTILSNLSIQIVLKFRAKLSLSILINFVLITEKRVYS